MKYNPLIFLVLCFSVSVTLAAPSAGEKQKHKQNTAGTNLELAQNHDPQAELESFSLLPGFEVNLFAAEPMLANPIHMTWDTRGRLWVVCSWSYPHLRPGEKPNDKIIILEDTDHDGQADKSTVFADGLYIPTGLALSGDSVYVAQTPDIVRLQDTDGDDVADVRQVALTGFAIEDSHHSISAWRRGPGGWIYFQEGVFLHSQVETQYGTVRLENGGVFQYHPKTQRLKIFADIRVGNPWGHMFDEWGQSFLIDNPRVHFLTPATANSRAKLNYNDLIKTQKQCGGDIISGRNAPPEMLGEILTCRFKNQSVVRYKLMDEGSGFGATLADPLIKALHPNFRPVDCKMGPDGGIYVCDWYNLVINHARMDFRDKRRDFSHGRIWRIHYKGRPLAPKPKIDDLPLPDLLEQLKAPEYWTRHQTKLALTRLDSDRVAKALAAWVKTLDPKAPRIDHHRQEALWAYQHIDRTHPKLLAEALRAKDPKARAAAARVIRYWWAEMDDPITLLEEAVQDESPRVRLEAVLSLSFIPEARALPVAMRVLDQPMDRFLEHALKLTTDGLGPYWRPALNAGTLKFYKPEHRARVSKQGLVDMNKKLSDDLRKVTRNWNPATLEPLLEKVSLYGNAEHTGLLLAALSRAPRPPANTAVMILNTLEASARQKNLKPKGKIKGLNAYIANPNPALARAAIRLAGTWKNGQASKSIQKRNQASAPSALRIEAVQALTQIGGKQNQLYFKKLTNEGKALGDHYLGIIGLTSFDLAGAAEAAAKAFTRDPQTADPIPVLQAFVEREGGADLLAKRLREHKPHAFTTSRLTDYLQRTGQRHEGLKAIFVHPVEQSTLAETLMKEDVGKLSREVAEKGNPEKGEDLFRYTGACISCHGIGDAGPILGPDLAALGSAAQIDYLIEAILEPNKTIAEGYASVLITTKDQRVYSGNLEFQNEREVVLHDAAQFGKKITIRKSDIKKLHPMPSIMPPGLANQLQNRQAFLDLIAFLSQLGKPGPFETSVKPIIRRWRIKAITEGELIDAKSFEHAADWSPIYSKVNGALPIPRTKGKSPDYLIQGQVEVKRAGKVALKLDNETGLRLWLDDHEVDPNQAELHLTAGTRNLNFAIDNLKRPSWEIRVELVDLPGSTARFKIVGGP